MNIVYFPEFFSRRAPDAMGVFFDASANEWISLDQVNLLLQAGHAVEIRQASPTEISRADAAVSLHEIGQMIAEKMHQLLDQDTPEEVQRKIEKMADAFYSIDVPHTLDVPVNG